MLRLLVLLTLAPACHAKAIKPPPFTPHKAAFPLRVSGRTLTDSSGKPYLLVGDSAWSLIANLTRPEAEIYFADRSAKGFSAVIVNLLEHKFAVNAPRDRSGAPPFLKTGDFSSANPAYFESAVAMVSLAAAHGLAVLLDVMYLGYGGGEEGFWAELNAPANTRDVCFRYGQLVGEKFRNSPNVVFVIGGDYTPPAGSEGEARLRRIVEGVKAAGATQLWTGHAWHGISADVSAFAGLIDLDAVYATGPVTYPDARRAFAHAMPAFLLETAYEEEKRNPGDPVSIRRHAWQAFLGGATAGVFYGHRDVWEFSSGSWNSGFGFGSRPWTKSLDAPGAFAMQAMHELLETVSWPELAPVTTKLIEGGGTDGQPDFVLAAANPARTLLVAYLPRGTPVTIDLAAFPAGLVAQWWDPCSAQVAKAANGPPSVTRAFTPLPRNACGDPDWILSLSRPTP